MLTKYVIKGKYKKKVKATRRGMKKLQVLLKETRQTENIILEVHKKREKESKRMKRRMV